MVRISACHVEGPRAIPGGREIFITILQQLWQENIW